MKCTDCNYEFKYTDKKYGISTYYDKKVIIQYRCAPCYREYKEQVEYMFRSAKDGVPY